jgi:HAD superfamily hydrolase (TIGR01509 family)/HAD superfamily hydrolase (TIGR01549 family)
MYRDADGFRYDRVIFDVGGTLLGIHDPRPFQEFLIHAGLPAGQADTRRLHRRLIGTLIALRGDVQGMGARDDEIDDWWRRVFNQAWPDRPDLAEEMLEWQHTGRLDRLFSDVIPALTELCRLGMPMAVLSNFGTHLRALLDHFGLTYYFDFVVVSSEERLAKPDPRIFERVVEKAGQPRQRLLYVGDHVGDDIEGARAAGLDAVLIDRRDHESEALCPRISSLLDLADYVQAPVKPARAIIFDMDGVVLSSPPMHLQSWQETLAPLDVELTADMLYPLEGMQTERIAQKLTESLLGVACSEEEARRLAQAKRARFAEIFYPSLVPGIGPLLHDMRGRGYGLGLVTGSAQSVVEESLAPTGVMELFETIVTGDDVEQGKPDPEPFQLAAEQLGIQPTECLVVENAPAGIQAARSAGMGCVALETTLTAAELARSGADQVFSDSVSLRNWLVFG